MAYVPQNWPSVIRLYLLNKCRDEVVDQILEAVAKKLGLEWDDAAYLFVSKNLGQAVTGTSIPATMANSLVGILKTYLFTFSMPAMYTNKVVPSHGTVWAVSPYPKNPYNPNTDQEHYVEYLVFSWIYSYLNSNYTFAEPIYRF